jgi:hypothetical protein
MNLLNKQDVISPIPQNKVIKGYFTCKNRSKSGLLRFYFYDFDSYELLISVEQKTANFDKLEISTSSINFDQSSLYFLGMLKRIKNSLLFQSTLKDSDEPEIIIERLETYSKLLNHKSLKFSIPNIQDRSKITSVSNDLMGNFLIPELKHFQIEKSEKNYLFNIKDNHLTSLLKLDKYTFILAASAPLNIFQAFCIAISSYSQNWN